jgi:hypothetical protein
MATDPDDPLSPDARGMPPVPPTGWRAHAVQRVQIGLIGLAAMVLLVGLASIIISNARQNEAQVVPEAASTVAPQQAASPVSDPLADVGVLPDLPSGDGEIGSPAASPEASDSSAGSASNPAPQ